MSDFTNDCLIPGAEVDHLRAAMCARCKNPDCVHAQQSVAKDKFAQRTSTQVDRLLRPEIADPTSSRYEHVRSFSEIQPASVLVIGRTTKPTFRNEGWTDQTKPQLEPPASQTPATSGWGLSTSSIPAPVKSGQTVVMDD